MKETIETIQTRIKHAIEQRDKLRNFDYDTPIREIQKKARETLERIKAESSLPDSILCSLRVDGDCSTLMERDKKTYIEEELTRIASEAFLLTGRYLVNELTENSTQSDIYDMPIYQSFLPVYIEECNFDSCIVADENQCTLTMRGLGKYLKEPLKNEFQRRLVSSDKYNGALEYAQSLAVLCYGAPDKALYQARLNGKKTDDSLLDVFNRLGDVKIIDNKPLTNWWYSDITLKFPNVEQLYTVYARVKTTWEKRYGHKK